MTDGSPASADQRAQFRLVGPSRSFDPKRQAIRPDLADTAEAHHHFAPHYARPADWVFIRAVTLRATASAQGEVVVAAQAGDGFALLDLTGGWAWGYRTADHMVGYVRAEDVAPATGE